MLSCRDVEVLLQDYVDGYLLPSQRDLLETHLRDCESCRGLVSGFARIDSQLDRVAEVEVPDELSRSILAKLPPREHVSRWTDAARRYALGGAFVALLLGLGFLLKGRYLVNAGLQARQVEVQFTAPYASSVAVVGDFNGWNPSRNRLVRVTHGGLWRTILKLPPGVYQYSFVVDGNTWTTDPLAKQRLADGFGGENSVIVVDG